MFDCSSGFKQSANVKANIRTLLCGRKSNRIPFVLSDHDGKIDATINVATRRALAPRGHGFSNHMLPVYYCSTLKSNDEARKRFEHFLIWVCALSAATVYFFGRFP